jgi:hypothetical protein
MGGGLMQLVAYGAQDIYLTGNPQITFFKVVYRRHTNFSMEAIQQTINGTAADGGSSTVTISRNGDLVYKVYVSLAAGSVTKGSDLVDQVELEIGGQLIDRQYQEWMNIWNELSTPESKSTGLKSMICDVGTRGTDGVGNIQVPLHFWFCRNPGLALPLIALQYHEVKLKLTWGSSHGGTTASAQVWADYIYLDTDERRRFAQVSHEYLIEQVQRQACSGNDSTKLNFNHPVKELIWTSVATNAYGTAQLKLNGHDRFAAQEEEYFQLRQPYDCHTAVPGQNLPSSAAFQPHNQYCSTTTIFSDVVTVPADATNPAFTITQPADTVLLHFGLVVTDAFTTHASDCGFDVGLGAGDKEFADGANALNNDASEVVVGAIVSTTTQTLANAGATALPTVGTAATAYYTATARTIHGTIDTGGAVTAAGAAKMFIQVAGTTGVQCRTSQMTKKINVYSFALKPEEHQPSGTCNFSRIDNAKLDTASSGTALTVSENIYAVNYNVLRIMSGMGGLAYSN